MKKENFSLVLILMMGLAISFTSCKKSSTSISDDGNISTKEALAQNIYDNVSNIADEAYDLKTTNLKSTDGWGRLFLGDCVNVSLDTIGFPRTLTIDFGEENCLCADGNYRRGKILVNFTGCYRLEGTTITHTFDEYYVNDNKVDGSRVVTNMGLNENNKMYFDIQVNGIIYLTNDEGSFSWNSSRTRVWEEGQSTGRRFDDVYLISGSSQGINADGSTWEVEIINPLRKEISCRHIVSGTMEIRPEGDYVKLIDFGNGECDNLATVIVNGETYTITLP